MLLMRQADKGEPPSQEGAGTEEADATDEKEPAAVEAGSEP